MTTITTTDTRLLTPTQALIFDLVAEAGEAGLTAEEVSAMTGKHHGQVSGPLSVLHLGYHLARLKDARGGFQPYVLPHLVGGRPTAKHKQHA